MNKEKGDLKELEERNKEDEVKLGIARERMNVPKKGGGMVCKG